MADPLRLLRFRHKVVRDLCWVMAAPGMLSYLQLESSDATDGAEGAQQQIAYQCADHNAERPARQIERVVQCAGDGPKPVSDAWCADVLELSEDWLQAM
eukprot:6174310-Pleurochrysis_carterae.AAC.2